MAISKETILYYNSNIPPYLNQMKGVMVQMGIRIKRITPEQTGQTVGYLSGMKDFTEQETAESPQIDGEMLVMRGFTSQRVDQLLLALRKAKVPRIPLKAVITESNCKWSFYHLYEEIKKEHEEMTNESVN